MMLVAVSLLLVGLAAGCGEEAGREGDTVTILMEGLKFTPSEVTIEPGVTVRWINKDQTSHTATAQGWQQDVEQPLLWNSMPMNPGDSFERTFDTEGIFDYFCMVHPYMTGKVTVVEEGGPEPTDAFVPTTSGQTTTTEGHQESGGAEHNETTTTMHDEGTSTTQGAGGPTTTTTAA